MADYSNIIPEDLLILSRTPTNSSFAPRFWEHANLTVDEDGDVRLYTRDHYDADVGVPVAEWNKRTLVYTLASSEGGQAVLDIKRLREDLSEGGRLAVLLDRVIAGHSVKWDGNNYVGHLTEDATEAHYELQQVADYAADYASDVDVWASRDWLLSGESSITKAVQSLNLGDNPTNDEITAMASRIVLEADDVVFSDDMAEAIQDLIEEAQQQAEHESI